MKGQENYGAGGFDTLYINGDQVGEGQIPKTMKFCYSLDESFDMGRDSASTVSEEYKAGAQFTGGNIERVVIDLAGQYLIDRQCNHR